MHIYNSYSVNAKKTVSVKYFPLTNTFSAGQKFMTQKSKNKVMNNTPVPCNLPLLLLLNFHMTDLDITTNKSHQQFLIITTAITLYHLINGLLVPSQEFCLDISKINL